MIIEGVLLSEGCEGLRVNQVGQRQKGRHSRDQQEHLIGTEYTSQDTQPRGEVEACLEKQFGT